MSYSKRIRAAVLVTAFTLGLASTAAAQVITPEDVSAPWDILFRFGLSLLFDDPVNGRQNVTGIVRCVVGDGNSVDIPYMRFFKPTSPGGFNQALTTCRALQQRWNNENPIRPIIVTPVVIGPPEPNKPPPGGTNSHLSVPEKIIEALTRIRPPRNETPLATAAACGAICLQLYVDSRTGLAALRGFQAVRAAATVGRAGLPALRLSGVPGMLAGGLRATGGGIGATGAIGEAALARLGGTPHAYFPTSRGARFVDRLVDGIAHESKV